MLDGAVGLVVRWSRQTVDYMSGPDGTHPEAAYIHVWSGTDNRLWFEAVQ